MASASGEGSELGLARDVLFTSLFRSREGIGLCLQLTLAFSGDAASELLSCAVFFPFVCPGMFDCNYHQDRLEWCSETKFKKLNTAGKITQFWP